MNRSDRILLVASAALAVPLALRFGDAPAGDAEARAADRTPIRAADAAPAAPRPAAPTADGRNEELGRFVRALDRFRRGEEEARLPLQESAERLCAEFGRCDVADVCAYYAALTPSERAQGLRDQDEFHALWARVRDLDGSGREAWEEQRARILADLDELSARVLARPDFVPAAGALSLSARIEVETLERLPDTGEVERDRALSRAADRARRALSMYELAGHLTPRLEPTWTLGRVERLRGRVGFSRRHFEACLEIARRVANADFREHALLGLVGLARDAGDVSAVDRHLAELASFRDPADCWALARSHAERLLHADHPEAALEFLVRHQPLEEAQRMDWHLLAGSALLRGGDLVAARAQFERLAGQPADVVHLASASLALHEERYEDAITLLDDEVFLASLDRERRAQGLALLGDALLRLGRAQEAIDPLERALEIAESWGERRVGEEATGSVIGEWLGLHTLERLARAWCEWGDPLEAARVIEDFQSRSLRNKRAALLDGPAQLPEHLGRRQLEAWAASVELGFVTWVIGADASVAVHVAPDGSARGVGLPRGRRALDEAVRRFREAVLAGDEARMQRLSAELLDEVLPDELALTIPASEDDGEPRRLLLLVHGPLEALPFAALDLSARLGGNVCPLVLPGVPSGEVGEPPTREALSEWTLLGSPVEAADTTPLLPAAERELGAVASQRRNARLVRGAAFDRRALEAALTSDRCLHVATHLEHDFVCEARRYAPVSLLLSGGERFCAGELPRFAPRHPLVVLAACETAGGRFVDAEGLHGLARAFLDCGTRNLLVTLWPVEDEAARLFSLAFHRALLAGDSPSHAATRARTALRRSGRPAADWAAFRLLGMD